MTGSAPAARLLAEHPEYADLAAKCLRIDRDGVLTHSEDLPDDNAVYVWRPIRGGGKIVIAADGTALFGASSIDRDTLFDLFRQGKRTDLSPLI